MKNKNRSEDELMWDRYGFHLKYEVVGSIESVRYSTEGFLYSRGISDFELEDSNIDIQTAKNIFIDLVDRIDAGEEIKDGTIINDVLGQFTLKFVAIENNNIKIFII